MPLHRRLPKRGFTNIFKEAYNLINLKDLNRFSPDSLLDIDELRRAGLIKHNKNKVKLLGAGEISHPLKIKIHKVSKKAREKVEAAGGSVDLIG